MAITAVTNCLGPPPLPPGKRFLQKSSRKLSSTYRSFRDPAIETWLSHGIPENLTANLYSRGMPTGKIGASQGLFRSCSEGDLRKRTVMLSSTPLNKCIKAIYGSWKNLLHRKCADIAHYATCAAELNFLFDLIVLKSNLKRIKRRADHEITFYKITADVICISFY